MAAPARCLPNLGNVMSTKTLFLGDACLASLCQNSGLLVGLSPFADLNASIQISLSLYSLASKNHYLGVRKLAW